MTQGAGVLFDCATALEFARRESQVDSIAIQRELCMKIHELTATSSPAQPVPACSPSPKSWPTSATASSIRISSSFPTPLDPAAIADWREGSVRDGKPGKSSYLYSARHFVQHDALAPFIAQP